MCRPCPRRRTCRPSRTTARCAGRSKPRAVRSASDEHGCASGDSRRRHRAAPGLDVARSERHLAYRAAVLPGLARREGSIQANASLPGRFSSRCSPPDRLHDLLRPARQRARKDSLSALLVHRTAAVDALLARHRPVVAESRGVCEPHQEGVFPEARHSGGVRSRGRGRLRPRLSHPPRHDGLLRGGSSPGDPAAAPPAGPDRLHDSGRGNLAGRAQRAVPGRSLRG